jgi:transcriptional regulator with XRE-family HTH domain
MAKRTLGSVAKEARNEARMSQRELAAAVGVKASHIAYIESGHRRPSISLIIPLSKALGLDAKELLILGYPQVKQILDGSLPSRKTKRLST